MFGSGAGSLSAFTIILLPGLFFLLCYPLQAAEVDQFTLPPGEPVELADSATILDAEVNRRIQQAIRRANSPVMKTHAKKAPRWLKPRCNEERLYKMLVGELGGSVVGQVESFAETADEITRRKVNLEVSVYRDFQWQASPTLVLTERMASVINLAGTEIGTDKLGHFLDEGYSYFLVTGNMNQSLESGLLFGEWSESVYFGAQTTGVYSFADLTANFQGMRFWNQILAQQEDPLTGEKPAAFVVCENEKWEQKRTFLWSEYVDNAWNESVNCPVLRSPELLQSIQKQNLYCRTEQLPLGKYSQWQPRLLNLEGYGILPDNLQPEVILRRRVAHQDVDLSEETLNYVGELRQRLEAWRRESVLASQQDDG